MSTRGAVLLAIGMLILGLLLGAVTGGAAGFFAGQNSRAALSQNSGHFAPPQVPQMPVSPRGLPPTANAINGARVEEVTADSPAAKAGLQVGDVITAIGGDKVDQNHSLSDLVQAKKPGDKVDLALTRGTQNLTVTVELGASAQNSSSAYLGIRFSPMFPGGGRVRPNG